MLLIVVASLILCAKITVDAGRRSGFSGHVPLDALQFCNVKHDDLRHNRQCAARLVRR